MIIHRTTYALYYKQSDEPDIIECCKRSTGNAARIYHRCKPDGEIIQSRTYNPTTQKLVNTLTTEEHQRKSLNQRNIAKGKPQYNEQ